MARSAIPGRPAIAGHGFDASHRRALLILGGLTWAGFFGLLAYSTWLAGAGGAVAVAVGAVAIGPGALALIVGGIGGKSVRGR